jgi:hypothetical protein
MKYLHSFHKWNDQCSSVRTQISRPKPQNGFRMNFVCFPRHNGEALTYERQTSGVTPGSWCTTNEYRRRLIAKKITFYQRHRTVISVKIWNFIYSFLWLTSSLDCLKKFNFVIMHRITLNKTTTAGVTEFFCPAFVLHNLEYTTHPWSTSTSQNNRIHRLWRYIDTSCADETILCYIN